MIDPWLSLAALSLTLAGTPVLLEGDPGPSGDCPENMRLVTGQHHDMLAHICRDTRDEGRTSRCYSYHEGFSVLEGPVSAIRVCMDQFEAPNQRGAKPMVMQSYDGAVKWCEKRGKRMCSEQEWELACEGPERRPWSYGWMVNTKLCNSGKGWRQVDFAAFDRSLEEAKQETERLWQGSISGRYKTCTTPFGVVDMLGNVEEWVTTREGRKHRGALMGGFWAKPWTGCRGTNDAHATHFAFYETGFRCCSDPKKSEAAEGSE